MTTTNGSSGGFASEHACHFLVDASMDAMLLTAPDGRILAANPAACRMFGRTEPELIAGGRAAVVDPSDPRLAAALAERARTGVFRGELTFTRADGSAFPGEVSTAIHVGPDGAALSSMVVRDVSDRYEAMRALQASERFSRATIDALPDHVAILDEDGRIIGVNRAWRTFAEQNGGSESRAFERTNYLAVCDAVTGDDRRAARRVSDAIRRALAGAAPDTDIEYACHAPHTQRWFIVNVRGFSEGSRHVVVSHHDVTKQHLAADALVRSHERYRALAGRLQRVREDERTAVAREIHDVLAQELTRIKIDLVWLSGRLTRCSDTASLTTLVPRVGEMAGLADDAIRSVQRIATGLRPAVLDSLGLCAAIEWHVRSTRDRSGLDVALALPANEPRVGRETSTALFRVLQESLTNVLRHAKATRVEVQLCADGEGLHLVVHDNGCGIPDGALDDPQSIGLSGMAERVALLGGRFEVGRDARGGTTVQTFVPPSPLRRESDV